MNTDLIRTIEVAFAGTPRGRVGIREASARDSRLDPGELYEDRVRFEQALRDDARESDWTQIPGDVIAADPAVFSHLDDAGFAFVLPAVMRWALAIDFDREQDPWDVVGSLAQHLMPPWRPADTPAVLVERWKLSRAQVSAVAGWLAERHAHPRCAAGPFELERGAQYRRLLA